MPLIFRCVRKNWWLDRPPWVPDGEVQARVLRDFFRDTDRATDTNELSFWRVEEDCSDLDDAILAVAAARNEPQNVDYALLPEHRLSMLGVKTSEDEGASPFKEANPKHISLIELTVSAVSSLANAIWDERRFKRKGVQEVKKLLRAAFTEDRLDVGMLHPSMLKKLQATV